jgi:hypothetical protein
VIAPKSARICATLLPSFLLGGRRWYEEPSNLPHQQIEAMHWRLYGILRKNSGMSAKVTPFLDLESDELDLFDFYDERGEQPSPRERTSHRPRQKWTPQIVDERPS